jgi:Antitoxin SocA-like, Panacea domain
LGDVKLNKILYFSDFLAYNRLGQPVTGARYQKQKLGPIAVPLLPAREELESEQAVKVETKRWPGLLHPQRITRALRKPQDLFSTEEREIVDSVIEELRPATADETSDLSHQRSPGWALSKMSSDIPYHTALIPPGEPSKDAIEAARLYARSASE